MPEKYVGTNPLSPQYSTVSLLALDATNTGGCGSLYGAGTTLTRCTRPSSSISPGAPWRAVASSFPHSLPPRAGGPRRCRLHAPLDALAGGVGDLPAPARGPREAVGAPRLEDEVDLLLEDVAVDAVVLVLGGELRLVHRRAVLVGAPGGRQRRARAEVLAEHVGPPCLVAAREADEAAPAREVVEDGRLLGDADRVLRAHRVAELADAHVLRHRRPVGVQRAGARADLVALGVEVVLDGRDAPEAELVGRLDEVRHAVDDVVVALDVAAQRPHPLALVLACGRHDGIQLEDRLDQGLLGRRLDGTRRGRTLPLGAAALNVRRDKPSGRLLSPAPTRRRVRAPWRPLLRPGSMRATSSARSSRASSTSGRSRRRSRSSRAASASSGRSTSAASCCPTPRAITCTSPRRTGSRRGTSRGSTTCSSSRCRTRRSPARRRRRRCGAARPRCSPTRSPTSRSARGARLPASSATARSCPRRSSSRARCSARSTATRRVRSSSPPTRARSRRRPPAPRRC